MTVSLLLYKRVHPATFEYQATGYYGNTQPVGLHVLIKTL